MVIFGAAGDLTKRKLIPAIYYLAEQKLLPESFALLGVARDPNTDEGYRALMRKAMDTSDEIHRVDQMSKDGGVAEDEGKRGHARLQKVTEAQIEKVDAIAARKEAEVMEV